MKYLRVVLTVAVALGLASCAKPPQAEIDAARLAVKTAAENVDILTYAPDSLRAAQEKMDALDNELASQQKRSPLSRSYDAVRSLAQEAVTDAQRARADADTSKQQVAKDAASLIEKVGTEIPTSRQRYGRQKGCGASGWMPSPRLHSLLTRPVLRWMTPAKTWTGARSRPPGQRQWRWVTGFPRERKQSPSRRGSQRTSRSVRGAIPA